MSQLAPSPTSPAQIDIQARSDSPPAPEVPGRAPRRHVVSVAWIGVTLWTVWRMCPWHPLFVFESTKVDPSWMAVLNEAAARGWRFGTEIAFTYGPFGFLHARMYHPETYALMLAAWIALASVTADSLWRLIDRCGLSRGRRLLCCVLLVEIMSRETMALLFGLHLLLFLDCVLIPAGPSERRSTRRRTILLLRRTALIAVLAILPWTKFSYVVTVAGLAACLSVFAMSQRRWPWAGTALPLFALLFWSASGHDLIDLRAYITAGLELSRGYSPAMGLGPATAAGWWALSLAAVLSVTTPFGFARLLAGNRWRQWITAGFLIGLLFVTWKSAFVRYHPSKLAIFGCTLLQCLIWSVLLSRISARPRSAASSPADRLSSGWIPTGAVLLLSCVIAGGPQTLGLSARQPALGLVTPAIENGRALRQSLSTPQWRRHRHERQIERIRQQHPLPDLRGPVDVIPSQLLIALAHGLPYQPRPVIQSYAAYTPGLAERNLNHYQSSAAPGQILFAVAPIDSRFPTQTDNLLWRHLLSHYRLQSRRKSGLILSRRTEAVGFEQHLLERHSVCWGEPVAIPECGSDLLWCRIPIEPNGAGRLASTLYRLPSVFLHVKTSAGETHRFRLIPEMADAGFVLSPLISDVETAAVWFGDTPEQSGESCRPRQLRVELELPTLTEPLFDEPFAVEFHALRRVKGSFVGNDRLSWTDHGVIRDRAGLPAQVSAGPR